MAPIIHCVRHAQGYHNLSVANHSMPVSALFGALFLPFVPKVISYERSLRSNPENLSFGSDFLSKGNADSEKCRTRP